MYPTITAIAAYAAQQLEECRLWTVHSVYKKTVNLQAGERLLALQAASSPMSPISIITDMDVRAFEVLPVKPGQQVSIAGSRIIISSPEHTVSFGCLPKKVCCTRLTCPPGPFPCKELLSRVRQAVASSQAGIFRLLFCDSTEDQTMKGKEEYSLILAAAGSRILQCSECLEQHLYGDAAKHLAGLIGLGIGLTPSGDDFLCGVLAGLILRGEENHPFAHALCREITSRRFDTNDISRAFLDCSVQHHFSLAVNSLTDLPSADRILNVFSDIGHSSGIDTLCGVAYGLSAEV